MKKNIISHNLGLLMEHFGIRNESQLAKIVDMPQTTVNKLINGTTADPRISTLLPFTQYFKISLDTLLSTNPVFDKDTQHQELLIPLVPFEKLNQMYHELISLTSANWPDWYPIPRENSEGYYAVRLSPFQLPRPFEQRSILIVKNIDELPDNNYCILKHLSSNSISIKRTVFDNGKNWLLALQTEIPPLEFDKKIWLSLGIIQFIVTDVRKNTLLQAERRDG